MVETCIAENCAECTVHQVLDVVLQMDIYVADVYLAWPLRQMEESERCIPSFRLKGAPSNGVDANEGKIQNGVSWLCWPSDAVVDCSGAACAAMMLIRRSVA
ncbi:hypothetical protein AF72_02445 [Xylella taiwanensis]|uniref:Uncharacterized protein n=1 Tax=Xylella taiwanensis TaxID=1444770 RepID=Z9JMR8_9GAMM|nr:hypothetical protein AB672_08995 [Xylella taiwanensis]EWS79086.1 hypothetical protein AF72_02445 [Xylella taiwanensis]